jgi:hypothetical protein
MDWVMIFQRSKYAIHCIKYGKPDLTAWGEHVWPQTGIKFVKDAATGRVIERTRDVKYLGRSEAGHNYYLGPKSKLKEEMEPIPSFNKNDNT